jgi:hypothetical protein
MVLFSLVKIPEQGACESSKIKKRISSSSESSAKSGQCRQIKS